MSMRLASLTDEVPLGAYVVVPPFASDALRCALRDAYHAPDPQIDPFADLMCQLDLIDFVPRTS